MFSTTWTTKKEKEKKNPDIHVLDEWKPATKMNPGCTIHEDWMRTPLQFDLKKKKKKKERKKGHIHMISPKMVHPTRDQAKIAEKKCGYWKEKSAEFARSEMYWQMLVIGAWRSDSEYGYLKANWRETLQPSV